MAIAVEFLNAGRRVSDANGALGTVARVDRGHGPRGAVEVVITVDWDTKSTPSRHLATDAASWSYA